jgi:hypothetical protein
MKKLTLQADPLAVDSLGCTTFNYTQQGGDTCSFCMRRESDSPDRCRCI